MMKKTYTKGELAKMILLGVAATGLVFVCVALPGLAQVYNLFNPKNSRDRKRLYQSISQLKKQKFIKIYRKNGNDVIEITEKGKRKILEYKLEDMEIKRPKKWDGLYRIIMFDIPEKKGGVRREVSQLLKDIGTIRLQKSTSSNKSMSAKPPTRSKRYRVQNIALVPTMFLNSLK